MTQEKKFVLKYLNYEKLLEANNFKVIIDPGKDAIVGGRYGINWVGCTRIRTTKPSMKLVGESTFRDKEFMKMTYIQGYIPPLIEGNIYLFSYTGELGTTDSISTYTRIENGEMKEFRNITAEFSLDKWASEEIRSLTSKIDSLEESSWNNKGYWDQELERLKREKNNLEKERNDWRTKFNNKNRESEDYKQRYEESQRELNKSKDERINENKKHKEERLRESNEKNNEILRLKDENSRLQTEKAIVEKELTNANNQIVDLTKRLENKGQELNSVKKEKDNQIGKLELKLDQKTLKIQDLNQQLSNLQIESNNKDNELAKNAEEIKHLKKKLGTTKKGAFDERLHFKEDKLERLVTQLGIELRKIHNLRRRYKQLIIAQEGNNNNDVNNAQDNIVAIKEGLQESGIDIDNIQRLCHKCEKLANLEIQLEKARQEQQYQAQQEQPTN